LREEATKPEKKKGYGRHNRRVKFDASYDE
jgi:hypothetical protein